MIPLRYQNTVLDVFYKKEFLSILVLDNGRSSPSFYIENQKPPEFPRFTRIVPALYLLEFPRPVSETSCRLSVVEGSSSYSWTVSREPESPVLVAACSIGAPSSLPTPQEGVLRVFYLIGPRSATIPPESNGADRVFIDWPLALPEELVPNHFLYRFARGNARFLTIAAPSDPLRVADLQQALSGRKGPNRFLRWEDAKADSQEFMSPSNIRGFDGRQWHALHGMPITREDFESVPYTRHRKPTMGRAFVALLFFLGMSIFFFTCTAAIVAMS